MLSEFDLIARFFTRTDASGGAVALGIGDDCALLAPLPGDELAISTDMLVEGRHFFPGADPEALGHKCLAVNLSDLAAMGAAPVAFTLALALPHSDPAWLAPFASGLLSLADAHQCVLAGGDTTRGPLTICITVFGRLPAGDALRRDKAREGDDIWVSGELGDARLALAHYRKETVLDPNLLAMAAARMHRPTPRVALGQALRRLAHAAIDVSDGLIGDLGHILARSGVGASLHVDRLPIGQALALQDTDLRRCFALGGGDDYELCFTAAPANRASIEAVGHQTGVRLTRIGIIEPLPGLRLVDDAGKPVLVNTSSFDHFSTP